MAKRRRLGSGRARGLGDQVTRDRQRSSLENGAKAARFAEELASPLYSFALSYQHLISKGETNVDRVEKKTKALRKTVDKSLGQSKDRAVRAALIGRIEPFGATSVFLGHRGGSSTLLK
jgi:hypothetical protein